MPLTWDELIAHLEVTEEEVRERAKESSMWARLVEVYKMKCKATIIAGLKKDPRALLRYFELEYASNLQEVGKEDKEWK